jgi:hypothetical protein
VNSVKHAAKRFAQATAEHTMTVLHDDGPYRHVRFRQPRNEIGWFELITVPGSLTFRGDGETYSFARTSDMFEFFRTGVGADGSVAVNPGYWAEKLTTSRSAVRTYSPDLFEKEVAEHLAEAESQWPGVTAAWNAAVEADNPAAVEEAARQALADFEFGDVHRFTCTCGEKRDFDNPIDAALWQNAHLTENRGGHRGSIEHVTGFRFHDTWEWSFEDYDWWYLWACHAIVWGIGQYDAAQQAGQPVAVGR